MFYLLLIAAYLVGSLSFAIIISHFYKMNDPRTYGSNNAGATNVLRSGNKKAAIITLLGDLLKGAIIVLIARIIYGGIVGASTLVSLIAIMVVVGHIYPIWFKFKGGKGVATSLGAILAISPLLALMIALTWLIVFKLSKISSLSAIAAAILAPIYGYTLLGNSAYFGAVLVLAIFILYTHKSNLIRLIKAEEKRI